MPVISAFDELGPQRTGRVKNKHGLALKKKPPLFFVGASPIIVGQAGLRAWTTGSCQTITELAPKNKGRFWRASQCLFWTRLAGRYQRGKWDLRRCAGAECFRERRPSHTPAHWQHPKQQLLRPGEPAQVDVRGCKVGGVAGRLRGVIYIM